MLSNFLTFLLNKMIMLFYGLLQHLDQSQLFGMKKTHILDIQLELMISGVKKVSELMIERYQITSKDQDPVMINS